MMAEYEEPFQGYEQAVGGMRDQMAGAPAVPSAAAASGGLDMGMLQQMLLQMSQPQQETPTKQMPQWLAFIPGAAKGYAMRQQIDQQAEDLKLRKQHLAGQQAQMKLQQMQMMQKIEQQQKLKRWGSIYGGLIQHEDTLDPEATKELEGHLVRELAQGGDPDAVQKFIEARQTARSARVLRALEGPPPEAPGAVPPAVQPPAPAAAPPPGPSAVYEQMARTYAQQVGVNPDLAVAVMHQESSGDPKAVGDGGKSVGLFQLQPDAAQEVGLTPAQRKDPQANIRGGVDYLKKQLDATGGNVPAALQRYNGGGTPGYAQQVLSRLGQGSTPPGMPLPAQMAQDQLALVHLRQQEDDIARKLQLTKELQGKAVAASREVWEKDIERIRKERERLENRLTFKGSDIEQVTGKPQAYLTGQDVMQGGEQLQQRRVETQAAQGREAAGIAGQKALDVKRAEQQAEVEKQGRGMMPDEKRKYLVQLRGDVRQEPSYKLLNDMRNAYNSVVVGSKRNDGPGDLALAYGYARLVQGDQSTVREGEFANVENAQGALQRLLNSPDKFFRGTRLVPEKRQEFLNAAQDFIRQRAGQAEAELRTVYEPMTKEAGLDFEQLVPLKTLIPQLPAPAGPPLADPLGIR